MNAFLQRITILESRLPAYPAYRNCLMDVFTSILKMCGFATKYFHLLLMDAGATGGLTSFQQIH